MMTLIIMKQYKNQVLRKKTKIKKNSKKTLKSMSIQIKKI